MDDDVRSFLDSLASTSSSLRATLQAQQKELSQLDDSCKDLQRQISVSVKERETLARTFEKEKEQLHILQRQTKNIKRHRIEGLLEMKPFNIAEGSSTGAIEKSKDMSTAKRWELAAYIIQRYYRFYTWSSRWKLLIKVVLQSDVDAAISRRNKQVRAMLRGESEYVHILSLIVNNYLAPFLLACQSVCPYTYHDILRDVFGEIESIYEQHRDFFADLMNRQRMWPAPGWGGFAPALRRLKDVFPAYARTMVLTSTALSVLEMQCEKVPMFRSLLDACEETCGASLPPLLAEVGKRPVGIRKTIESLISATPDGFEEKQELMKVADELSEAMKDAEASIQHVAELMRIEVPYVPINPLILLDALSQGLLPHHPPIKVLHPRLRPVSLCKGHQAAAPLLHL